MTEKKGYGLRASKALPAETFVFEYLGEVVEEKEMSRRMQQYKDEGIRHFYFMMLQREEVRLQRERWTWAEHTRERS